VTVTLNKLAESSAERSTLLQTASFTVLRQKVLKSISRYCTNWWVLYHSAIAMHAPLNGRCYLNSFQWGQYLSTFQNIHLHVEKTCTY